MTLRLTLSMATDSSRATGWPTGLIGTEFHFGRNLLFGDAAAMIMQYFGLGAFKGCAQQFRQVFLLGTKLREPIPH
jgi:hypothetical protein